MLAAFLTLCFRRLFRGRFRSRCFRGVFAKGISSFARVWALSFRRKKGSRKSFRKQSVSARASARAQWEPLFREVVAGRFPMSFSYVGNFPLAPPCSTTEIFPEIFDLHAECFVKKRSCFIVCCLDEVFVIKLCWVLCLDARTTCFTQHEINRTDHDGVRPVFSIENTHQTARLNARQLCQCMQAISNCDGCTKTHRRPQTATKCKQL